MQYVHASSLFSLKLITSCIESLYRKRNSQASNKNKIPTMVWEIERWLLFYFWITVVEVVRAKISKSFLGVIILRNLVGCNICDRIVLNRTLFLLSSLGKIVLSNSYTKDTPQDFIIAHSLQDSKVYICTSSIRQTRLSPSIWASAHQAQKHTHTH